MENAIVNQNSQQLSHDNRIEDITNKIKWKTAQAQRFALEYAIEIGGYLTEAKALLPHGEWGNWLKNKVNYSHSTAINFMKLYEEYGNSQESLFSSNSQAVMNLPYTKALRLLAIPEDEREQFVEENNVEEMSTRELEKAIKERDEAKAKLEDMLDLQAEKEKAESMLEYNRDKVKDLNETVDSLSKEIAAYKDKLDKAKAAEKKAKDNLKALKENPEIPQEVTDKLKAEAEAKATAEASAEIEKKLADANSKIEAANLAKQAAERDAAKAQQSAEELKKQLQMSSPDVAEFKVLFAAVQENMSKLKAVYSRIAAADSELGAKLGAAISAFINQCNEVS
ncbi:MAG: DUF3102 domain-containing protein [Clostridia bacterium]|nr:DUF3102 domain-containing protein [Clostridia bacterium]